MSSDGASAWRRASLVACAAGAAGVSVVAAIAAMEKARSRRKTTIESVSESVEEDVAEVGYSWPEIVGHHTLDSTWIVIRGEVYDVTPFLQEHPGGRLLLLAYAGSDATEPFTTIGHWHRDLAMQALKRYHIGHVKKSAEPFPHQGNLRRLHSQQSGRRFEIVGGYLPPGPRTTPESTPLWGVNAYGFLPSRDPVPLRALHGTAFEVFADLVELLPGLSATGAFRKYLNTNVSLHEKMRQCTTDQVELLTEDAVERAFSAVGFCISAYWRGGNGKYGNGLVNKISLPLSPEGTAVEALDKLPDFLSMPMLAVSNYLQRPPMIDYAATVLYNWERIDPNGPIVAHNIRTVARLTALGDEEWFFKTHVVIESEAAPAVSAIIRMMESEDDSALLENLVALEEALWRVVRACMPIMYERAEQGVEHGVSRCSEHVFYQVLRPLLSSGKITFEGDPTGEVRDLNGPSGAMSSLLPAVDAALGIEMTSVKLRQALDKFALSMPQAHQQFLASLKQKDSIRTRIILSKPIAGGFDEHYEALVRSYNRCISRVLDFRWQHWQYVKNFIMKPGNLSFATGTGGTHFDYLQQHITDTEQSRLTEYRTGSTLATPFTPDDLHHLPSLPAALTDGNVHYPGENTSYWKVDGPRGLLAAEPMLGLEDWELWRATMPDALHGAVKSLLDLTMRLPSLCACDEVFYARCEQQKDNLAALRENSLLLNLSEVSRERLLTLLCFVAAGCRATSDPKKVPKCIDMPLQFACRLVGRSPHIDTVPLVLSNWTADDKNVPDGGSGLNHGESLTQLRVVCTFIGSPDEEWYRAVHLVLHESAREAVAAIRAGQLSSVSQDDRGVVQSLETLTSWMNRVCDYFDAHFDQKDSRTEAVSYRRLARFVAQDWFDDEQTACWVYSGGSSVLMPALHAFLGLTIFNFEGTVDSSEVERLRAHLTQWTAEMMNNMPAPHRTFLDNLQKPGVSLRQYCIKRFGAIKTPIDVLHGIEVAYNEALNALVRFLSRRMHLVVRFQPDLSSAFATLHNHVEAGLRKNRLQLLKMRQRVDACLESSYTPTGQANQSDA